MMKSSLSLGTCLALLAPAAALAQAAPAARPNEFQRMWTGWRAANSASLTIERSSVERVRQDLATADAERRRQLLNQGRALGERVGEIVRLGDCEEGERVARAAGDFALVEAVRDHCRAAAVGAQR
jgi:hypothetical protein